MAVLGANLTILEPSREAEYEKERIRLESHTMKKIQWSSKARIYRSYKG